jgi:hypothetical protein
MEAGISIPSHEKSGKNLQVCGEIAPFRPVSGTHMQKIGEKLAGVSEMSDMSDMSELAQKIRLKNSF